ncbi:MAG: hypothetical protein HDS68_04890 [Bacteroidales bacterium]|nr:hypothetical protein [Bacteroidales bacterium]
MDRTKLDEKSFKANNEEQKNSREVVYPDNVTIEMAIKSGQLMAYLGSKGFQYEGEKESLDGTDADGWRWRRRNCVLDDWNYLDHNDLFEEAMRQFKEYYANRAIPGSSLDAHFYPAYARSIPEALEKHYGVLLRVVDRIVEQNAQTLMYGKDYLVIGYNPVLQQYVVIEPSGALGTLDALAIQKGEIKTISYIYYSKNR